jgi:hypothetical protein
MIGEDAHPLLDPQDSHRRKEPSMRVCLWSLLVVAIFISLHGHAEEIDRCSDILENGVFDQTHLDAYQKNYHLFQQAFCNSSSEEDNTSLGQQFSYLTPTESYAGTWNASNTQQRRALFCQETLDYAFKEESLRLFVTKASPVIVEAWSKCMEKRSPNVRFSADYSDDFSDVTLAANSGFTGVNLSFHGKKSWRDQLIIQPADALTCGAQYFHSDRARDTIQCKRAKTRLKETVKIQLLTKIGDVQPWVSLPSIEPPRPPAPPDRITSNTYLSKDLETGKHTFRSITYERFVGTNSRPYPHGMTVASQDTTGSVVTYKIPLGAKDFVTDVTTYQAGCGGGGNVNGWRVFIKTPNEEKVAERSWNYIDAHSFTMPVDNIPYGHPREIAISVDPMGDRTCDHAALGDPHFTPLPLKTN